MSHPLLVRHPAPYSTESLLGYLVRLTGANGYASPKDLYRLAGVAADRITVRGFDASMLASITGHPESACERIALTRLGSQPDTAFLLGNKVKVTDLTLWYARVCPQCVAEKGFIEAHWLLGFMAACPVHRRAAVWYCEQCKARISWLRSGLLICQCGAPFSPPRKEDALEPELQLLDIVRRKVLSDPTVPSNTSVPEVQFAELNLGSTLRLITFLGKRRLGARGCYALCT